MKGGFLNKPNLAKSGLILQGPESSLRTTSSSTPSDMESITQAFQSKFYHWNWDQRIVIYYAHRSFTRSRVGRFESQRWLFASEITRYVYLLYWKARWKFLILLYISNLDVLRGSSASQADLDLQKIQSKVHKKYNNMRLLINLLDERFDSQKAIKLAYGKVEEVCQFFFSLKTKANFLLTFLPLLI